MSFKLVNYLSDEEIEILHQVFDLFDKEGTGEINISELIKELKRFNFDNSEPTIFEMVSLIETDANKKINFTTFLDGINNKVYKTKSEENMKKIFNIFADPKSGNLPLKTLQNLSEEIGDNLSQDELKELLKELSDSNPITFEEFNEMMAENNLTD